MCCMTHDDRDRHDTQHGVAFLMAANDRVRCRCTFNGDGTEASNSRCRRFADAEDLLCEWCRQHKGFEAHVKACYEIGGDGAPPMSFRAMIDEPFRSAEWLQTRIPPPRYTAYYYPRLDPPDWLKEKYREQFRKDP